MPMILLLTPFIWITPTWEALAFHNRTANFSKDSRALSTPWGGWLVLVGWYNLDGHRWMLRCSITPSCMMVKHYNAPLLHFISFQVLGVLEKHFRRENLLFTRLGAASVWSLNARKARMFGAEVFFWIISQMRIGNILNVLHELRPKETGLSCFF